MKSNNVVLRAMLAGIFVMGALIAYYMYTESLNDDVKAEAGKKDDATATLEQINLQALAACAAAPPAESAVSPLCKNAERVAEELEDGNVPQPIPGPQGVQGIEGIQGPVGPQGQRGRTGPQGPVGPIGPVGPEGEDGIGQDGAAGADGQDGDSGAQGPPGPAGPAGPPGQNGQDGATGPQGPAGEPGAAGLPGEPADTYTYNDFPTPGFTTVCVRDSGSPDDDPAYACTTNTTQGEPNGT